MTPAERYEEALALMDLGESPVMALKRLGLSARNASRWYRRNGYIPASQLMERLAADERNPEWTREYL